MYKTEFVLQKDFSDYQIHDLILKPEYDYRLNQ